MKHNNSIDSRNNDSDELYEYLIDNLHNNIGRSNTQEVYSDNDLYANDMKSLTEHNAQYTLLLKQYVKRFSDSAEETQKYRKAVFVLSSFILGISSLAAIAVLVIIVIMALSNKLEVISSLTAIITASISFFSAYIVIPKIIIEYLFNKEEEKNLTEIIGRIQDYDSKIRDKS